MFRKTDLPTMYAALLAAFHPNDVEKLWSENGGQVLPPIFCAIVPWPQQVPEREIGVSPFIFHRIGCTNMTLLSRAIAFFKRRSAQLLVAITIRVTCVSRSLSVCLR